MSDKMKAELLEMLAETVRNKLEMMAEAVRNT
jgi:hypothetical protein